MTSLQHSLFLGDELRAFQATCDDISSSSSEEDDDEISNEREMFSHALENVLAILSVVRCAAHTLQLAVHDSFKHLESNEVIGKVRTIVKLLRLDRYKELVQLIAIKLPKLDVITRWNSTFDMMHSFLEIKDQLKRLDDMLPSTLDFQIPDLHWTWIKSFIEAYAPVSRCTVKLQSAELAMSKLKLIDH